MLRLARSPAPLARRLACPAPALSSRLSLPRHTPRPYSTQETRDQTPLGVRPLHLSSAVEPVEPDQIRISPRGEQAPSSSQPDSALYGISEMRRLSRLSAKVRHVRRAYALLFYCTHSRAHIPIFLLSFFRTRARKGQLWQSANRRFLLSRHARQRAVHPR